MTNPNTQRVRVVIEYDAEVFPGDPDDVYQVAFLEQESIFDQGWSYIPDVDYVEVFYVEPVFDEVVR